jgi:hypothetical protein
VLKNPQQKSFMKKYPNPHIRKKKIEKWIVISISSTFILASFYFLFKNNSIKASQTSTINVTLLNDPTFHKYKIKSSTHRDIIFETKEFYIPFRITSFTYKAALLDNIKRFLKRDSTIILTVDKSQFTNKYSEKYIEVYQIKMKEKQFVDLELREQLIDKDARWSIVFIILGCLGLFSIISNKVSEKNIEKLIFLICVITFITLLIFS